MVTEFEELITEAIYNTLQDMTPKLSFGCLRALQDSMFKNFAEGANYNKKKLTNEDYINRYIEAKTVEGMAESSLSAYQSTILKFIKYCDDKLLIRITTDDVRAAINTHKKVSGCSDYSLDTFRRRISAFFSWLLEEEYIVRNPVCRVHKINYTKKVKTVFTDEEIERLIDECVNYRQLAILGMLRSTGVRVGELASLKLSMVDIANRECVVRGKGNKERTVYFDAKTKHYLEKYIEGRTDDVDSVFVTKIGPCREMSVRSIQREIHNLGILAEISKCHPHKFRSTLATKAIDGNANRAT